jgi:hypothetical protein
MCIVNPRPASPLFSERFASTLRETWVCDPRSALYVASASDGYAGEQRIDGAAYAVAGLLGISGSALLLTGGVYVLRGDTAIDALGVAMIGVGAFAGGAGIWAFTKGMRILFGAGRK